MWDFTEKTKTREMSRLDMAVESLADALRELHLAKRYLEEWKGNTYSKNMDYLIKSTADMLNDVK